MSRVVLAAFDPVPAPKGASAHILANHRALSSAHEVSLVTLGAAPLPGLRHIAIAPGDGTWLKRAIAFSDRCRAIFGKHAPDIVHARSPFEGLATPDAATKIAEVNALYSVEMPYHYPGLSSAFRSAMRALEITWLERAEAIVTPSAVTAAYLADLGFAGAVVVPNAPSVDLPPAAPRPLNKPRPAGAVPLRLVYVGTLAAWQGISEVIEVLPRLVHLDPQLTIYTATRKRRWVDRLAAKRGVADRVRFADSLPPSALGAALAEHDLGLAPLVPTERNLVQGCMPIKVLDYMRAGIAVVAPDLPVVRELVGPDAPLYRPWSRQRLVEGIEQLATIDRSALVTAGAARVEARFSHEVQRRALLEVYDALA